MDGVIVILKLGTKIPEWIEKHEQMEVISHVRRTPQKDVALRVHKGNAVILDGLVYVRLPGSVEVVPAFQAEDVLLIKTFGNRDLFAHECFCLMCRRLEGFPVEGVGVKRWKCRVCGNMWPRSDLLQ